MTFTLKASAADWEWENWNDPNAGGHGYPSLDFGTAGEDLARCFAKESFVQDLQPQLSKVHHKYALILEWKYIASQIAQ